MTNGLGLGTQKGNTTVVQGSTVWPPAWLEFMHDPELGRTMGSGANTDRVIRLEDQINNFDWVADTESQGPALLAPDPLINNYLPIDNDPGSRMTMSPGPTQPNPYVIYFLCRVGYTSNFSSIFRDQVAYGGQNQITQRTNGDSAEMLGANSGTLNINGTNGLNWDSSTGAILTTGAFAPWALLKFLWTDTGFSFSRNGVVEKSGNTPVVPRPFIGHALWLGVSNSWQIALDFGGPYNPSTEDDAAIIAYINSHYGLSL